ncbi:MAG: hypothetical protein A4E27_01360 [Methanobacterium sp. PtaU1.Bin242]|nr:MAG: hypothetical protein A4E27_01360 [Methanobacterium sp. PtaU1.Bin242]
MKVHPIISIIFANLFLCYFLNIVSKYSTDTLQLLVFSIIIIIFGGYIAYSSSWSDKAIIGLYNSLLFLLLSLLIIKFVFKTELSPNKMLFFFIILPISGLIGGYIGKLSRKYLANEQKVE